MAPTGKNVKVSGMTRLHYQDGKAVEELVYYRRRQGCRPQRDGLVDYSHPRSKPSTLDRRDCKGYHGRC
jgi:hypothetical protein